MIIIMITVIIIMSTPGDAIFVRTVCMIIYNESNLNIILFYRGISRNHFWPFVLLVSAWTT